MNSQMEENSTITYKIDKSYPLDILQVKTTQLPLIKEPFFFF
jgi:hypothetical protein